MPDAGKMVDGRRAFWWYRGMDNSKGSGLDGIRITQDGADFMIFKVHETFLMPHNAGAFVEFVHGNCKFPFVIVAQKSDGQWIANCPADTPEAVKTIARAMRLDAVNWQWIPFL